MKVRFIESEYGDYWEVTPHSKELLQILELISEDVDVTAFNMSIRVHTSMEDKAETRDKIDFAITNKSRILEIISEKGYTFTDIYYNPELLSEETSPEQKEDAAIDDSVPYTENNNAPEPSHKTTDAQRRALKKYNEKFEILKIKVLPEYKKMVFDRAEEKGMSVTAYIKSLIDSDIGSPIE